MPDLPEDLGDLIASSFDSVESLEIAMLLRRSPQTFWGARAVAEQLGMKPELAKAKLEALRNRGLLVTGEHTGAFRYVPSDDALSRRIDELVAVYSDRRASVLEAIYSANLERLRALSNAFRVK